MIEPTRVSLLEAALRALLGQFRPCTYHGGDRNRRGVFGDGPEEHKIATWHTYPRDREYCDACRDKMLASSWTEGDFTEIESAPQIRTALAVLGEKPS